MILPPTLVTAPVVSLDQAPGLIGDNASTTDGIWTDATSFTYQWMRNSVEIGGATSATYTLTEDDADQALSCVVTAHGPGGTTSEPSSNNVIPAELSVPSNLVAPSIFDDMAGFYVDAEADTWPANPPNISRALVWQSSIDNNTIWFDVVPAQTGSSIDQGGLSPTLYYRLQVIATNTQGSSAPAYSNSLQIP